MLKTLVPVFPTSAFFSLAKLKIARLHVESSHALLHTEYIDSGMRSLRELEKPRQAGVPDMRRSEYAKISDQAACVWLTLEMYG